jgi:hypothetical protein
VPGCGRWRPNPGVGLTPMNPTPTSIVLISLERPRRRGER